MQKYCDTTTDLWVDALINASERVVITKTVTACRDAKDNKFLELAVDGRADILISGDNDLLSMINHDGIPIVTPAIFLKAFYR